MNYLKSKFFYSDFVCRSCPKNEFLSWFIYVYCVIVSCDLLYLTPSIYLFWNISGQEVRNSEVNEKISIGIKGNMFRSFRVLCVLCCINPILSECFYNSIYAVKNAWELQILKFLTVGELFLKHLFHWLNNWLRKKWS